jgi:hypothetical protein
MRSRHFVHDRKQTKDYHESSHTDHKRATQACSSNNFSKAEALEEAIEQAKQTEDEANAGRRETKAAEFDGSREKEGLECAKGDVQDCEGSVVDHGDNDGASQ